MLDIWIDNRETDGREERYHQERSPVDWFRSPQLMIAKATVPVLSYPMPRRWISDAARRNRGGNSVFFFDPL